jgi:hypothetical protein
MGHAIAQAVSDSRMGFPHESSPQVCGVDVPNTDESSVMTHVNFKLKSSLIFGKKEISPKDLTKLDTTLKLANSEVLKFSKNSWDRTERIDDQVLLTENTHPY